MSSEVIRLANFINGEKQPPSDGLYLENLNPAHGKLINLVPDSSELDMISAIQSANKAFPAWSKLKPRERADFLFRIADRIEQRLDELALAETTDVGKPLWLARESDIPRAVLNFKFFAEHILHRTDNSISSEQTFLAYNQRRPLGVAGLIVPWNLPLYLATWKIAPAIAAGNTCVVKPSEMTPTTVSMLAEILLEVGLPPGVVNIVHGRGETVGALLVRHPGVPLISFTGGTETGKRILSDGASGIKKISLELGGKNSALIFNDADLKAIVPDIMRSCFINQGQVCLAHERLLVQEGIYPEFVAEMKRLTKELVVGDPVDPKSFMGPLISRAHHEKVARAVAEMTADQGQVQAGSEELTLEPRLREGHYMRPVLMTDLSNCSPWHHEEVFGPVVNVTSFKYASEAIKLANTPGYGLAATVWTKDLARAHKTAASLDVGTVWINSWMIRDLRLPFGGTKQSGLGREGADYSMDFFTDQKAVVVKL